MAAEHGPRGLNLDARKHCEAVGDFVTKNIFEEFLTDEDGHIDFFETQLDLIAKLGEEKYVQLNASKMDEAEWLPARGTRHGVCRTGSNIHRGPIWRPR
ncbi:ferritin-like protein [Pelagimonas varians]|uniref:Bacterioferritin n=1 Tax=Pelagimonas varians TaxID=696760 RepID=A0A238L2X7_9RHOB|nr:ferritin-like protein [Pelagimonas varians]SMX49210.1 Bacterioferritin [Pelagimonas varians]